MASAFALSGTDASYGGGEMDMGGGGCPTTNLCAINDRASFLLVKLSTVDLMNIWGPGYRSTR